LRETLRRLTDIMLRFWDRANAITLGALVLSCAVALLAMRQSHVLAMIALIGAGICDLFDGIVARRLNRTHEEQIFGQRLDSLVDACAFGVAPLVLCCGLGLTTLPDCFLLVFFTCCVVWRLAYFDTVGMEQDGVQRFYVGLPTTYVALVIPLVFLSVLTNVDFMRMLLRVALLGLAGAMVSSLRVPKPRMTGYVFLLILALVVVSILWLQLDRFQSAFLP
jgi:CDP-diacylglycerol--serine O-phosphatidyltransferase